MFKIDLVYQINPAQYNEMKLINAVITNVNGKILLKIH